MQFSRRLAVITMIVACGGDGTASGAGITSDAPASAIDTMPDAPVAVCDYSEQHDATNDDVSGADAEGVAEDTAKLFGTDRLTICGQLDSAHFLAPELVDIDGYLFKVTSDADVRIEVAGAGLETLRDVTVDLYSGPQFADLVSSTTKFAGNHAVYEAHLVAGTYELVIEGGNDNAITAPIAYKAKIINDKPAQRCPMATGAASYNEARDGAVNDRANDMVAIHNPIEKLTAANELPEPTALIIAPQTAYRINGSSADIAATSSYKDIDTFQITTGETTNEISVRLNWPGATQDLDLFVFAAGTVPRIGRSTTAAQHENEFKTFAVKPNSEYWLTVANDKNSGAGAVNYELTVCGASFVP